MATPTFASTRRLSAAKQHEYSIIDTYKLGYRNREDVTNTAPGVLIVGSQNVLTNVSDRVQIRQGYSLDGAMSFVQAPILSSFDWLTRGNGEVHMRAGNLTSAGNDGKLQFRYVATDTTLGNQLITNPYFTGNATGWNSYSGATSNGALPSGNWAYNSNNVIHSAGSTNSLGQNVGIAPSNPYHVEFTVGGTVGSVSIQLGDAVVGGPYAAGSGAQSVDLTSAGDSGGFDGLFLIVPTSNFDGTIDSVRAWQIFSNSHVTWVDLLTSLTTVSYNFTKFFNTTESLREVLFVNGSSNIYRWNGATAVLLVAGAASLTKTGTQSWLDAGFYSTADKSVVINGNTYTYTGGESTTTLTGVSPSPVGEPPDSLVIQSVVTTANSAMTDIPATFPNALISTLNNQVFVAALTSSAVYISNVNSYTDYSSSTPREAGEGGVLILDDNIVGFKPQEQYMYITAGQDLWYNVNFEIQTSTVGITYEQVNALALKTGRRQAAISQAFLSHMKNNIIVVTQETTIDTFGRVESSLATPQTTNISDPIKLDIDDYDFTNGSIFYWRFYILVAVPAEGIVRIYNLATKGWEAPQTLPISRFYVVDGELYGHSYNTSESYKLFDGYTDRSALGFVGYPIQAIWKFSYQNYGSRFSLKKATKAYVEGYINAATTLTCTLSYELDGCMTVKTFTLDGTDSQFVCIGTDTSSLGKTSLGKVKLGGDTLDSIQGLPPKFRWFPTFTNTDFFECSFQFSVLGSSNRMELLAFGLAVSGSSEIPVQKMD